MPAGMGSVRVARCDTAWLEDGRLVPVGSASEADTPTVCGLLRQFAGWKRAIWNLQGTSGVSVVRDKLIPDLTTCGKITNT